MEQGCCSGDVLARSGEVWEGFIISDDPPVHIAGHDARAPVIFVALDLLVSRSYSSWSRASSISRC